MDESKRQIFRWTAAECMTLASCVAQHRQYFADFILGAARKGFSQRNNKTLRRTMSGEVIVESAVSFWAFIAELASDKDGSLAASLPGLTPIHPRTPTAVEQQWKKSMVPQYNSWNACFTQTGNVNPDDPGIVPQNVQDFHTLPIAIQRVVMYRQKYPNWSKDAEWLCKVQEVYRGASASGAEYGITLGSSKLEGRLDMQEMDLRMRELHGKRIENAGTEIAAASRSAKKTKKEEAIANVFSNALTQWSDGFLEKAAEITRGQPTPASESSPTEIRQIREDLEALKQTVAQLARAIQLTQQTNIIAGEESMLPHDMMPEPN